MEYYNRVKQNWSDLIVSCDDNLKIISIELSTNECLTFTFKIVEETEECLLIGWENKCP